MRTRRPVVFLLLLWVLATLALAATAGWLVAAFASLTLLLGGLAVMAINART